MRMIFAVLALLLILTGVVLLAVPREQPAVVTRGINVQQVVTWYSQVRGLAEQVNAPLSIVCGLFSLYYSRKRYVAQVKS